MNLITIDRLKQEIDFKYPPKTLHEEYVVYLPKNNVSRATFQRAMKLTIIIGQIFALNPVLGVCDNDVSKLRYSKYSWKMIYTVLSLINQSFLVIMCILKFVRYSDTSFGDSTTIVFLGTNFITTILFLHIATKWPKLVRYIAKLETADPNVDTTIVRKCNISCVLILILALLEHLLSVVSGLALAMACQPNTPLYDAFIYQSFTWVWGTFEYNIVIALLCQLANIQFTFNWNFANVFVICLSWYLEVRITQITDRINSVRGKHAPSNFWRTMREDYCKAANLVRKVDEVINGVIFISFANNLFAICWQLLHMLEDGFRLMSVCGKTPAERPMMHGFEQVVYFAYSFIFLIARSLAVSLIAARVHSATKEVAKGLYDVPASAYCVEVQRFIDQVHGDNVALSGLQFFDVKRGLVLAITGTIITYELVLMQFTGVTTASPTPLPGLTYSNMTTTPVVS